MDFLGPFSLSLWMLFYDRGVEQQQLLQIPLLLVVAERSAGEEHELKSYFNKNSRSSSPCSGAGGLSQPPSCSRWYLLLLHRTAVRAATLQ